MIYYILIIRRHILTSLITYLYKEADGLKKAVCLLTLAVYITLTVYGGGSLLEMAVFGCAMVFYVWLPGKLWNTLLGGTGRFDGIDFGTDILLGSGFFCAVYCVAMRLHMRLLLIVLPLVLAVVCIAVIIRRGYLSAPEKLSPFQWLPVLLFFGLLLLYTFTTVIKSAKPVNVGDTLLSSDMLWNIGNANAFTLRFIPEDIRYSGVQLHYHYLTELFAGAVSWLTGISAYNIVAFYMQPWVLGCVVYALYAFGKVWYEDRTKAMVFTFSMFVFGCGSVWTCFLNGRSTFFNDNAKHIITNINAQSTATLFLCIFGAMFVQLLEKSFDVSIIDIILWLAAFFMLSFAKGPVAAIVAVGGAITIVWLFAQKKVTAKGLFAAVAMAGLFFVIYTLFFASGANTSMAFNIWGTAYKTLWGDWLYTLEHSVSRWKWLLAVLAVICANTFMFAPAQVVMYIVGLGSDIRNLFRLDGKRLWANSMVAGGFMAYYLFDHYAMSQVYFAFLGLFFLHVMAVDNLQLLSGRIMPKIAAVAACVAVATTMFMYVNYIGSGARFLARNLGIIEKYPYNTVINADDQAAMEYLAENSPENALFATNRIHASNSKKDGISNIYSAFSGRQSYMEGYAYALTNMGVPYYVIDQRKVINDRLFSEDTPAYELLDLCQRTGITHLVYSTQMDGTDKVISTVFEKIYHSETVKVYSTGMTPLANHPLYQQELAQYGEGIKD